MKKRAPNLTADDVKAILSIIDGWNEPALTWPALISRITPVLHATYVRQTLHRYPEVAQAFAKARVRLAASSSVRPRAGSLKIASDRIQRLEAEVTRLRAQNDALLERFVTWAYNASLFGLDEQKLDQPIPPAQRS